MEERNKKDLNDRSKWKMFQEEGPKNATKKKTAETNSVRTLIEPNFTKTEHE